MSPQLHFLFPDSWSWSSQRKAEALLICFPPGLQPGRMEAAHAECSLQGHSLVATGVTHRGPPGPCACPPSLPPLGAMVGPEGSAYGTFLTANGKDGEATWATRAEPCLLSNCSPHSRTVSSVCSPRPRSPGLDLGTDGLHSYLDLKQKSCT